MGEEHSIQRGWQVHMDLGQKKLGMVQGTARGVGGVGKKAGERSRQGQFMWGQTGHGKEFRF